MDTRTTSGHFGSLRLNTYSVVIRKREEIPRWSQAGGLKWPDDFCRSIMGAIQGGDWRRKLKKGNVRPLPWMSEIRRLAVYILCVCAHLWVDRQKENSWRHKLQIFPLANDLLYSLESPFLGGSSWKAEHHRHSNVLVPLQTISRYTMLEPISGGQTAAR